jgi:hypothetical protein
MKLEDIFNVNKPVIGVLHLPALPGSPENQSDLSQIREWLMRDAEALAGGGVDGFILENLGDAPFYPHRVPAHTIAFMTALGKEVKARFELPLGVNVLRNDAVSALAVAAAIGAEFIRVNVYTGARLTDQGIIQGEAHEILRLRKLLDSRVKIFADVAVKHSAPLAVRDLKDEVEETIARGRADAVIVSGSGTGKEASLEDVAIAKDAAGGAPVLVGSGMTLKNVASLLAYADGLIVGTFFKRDGVTANPVDPARVKEFMEAVNRARVPRHTS